MQSAPRLPRPRELAPATPMAALGHPELLLGPQASACAVPPPLLPFRLQSPQSGAPAVHGHRASSRPRRGSLSPLFVLPQPERSLLQAQPSSPVLPLGISCVCLEHILAVHTFIRSLNQKRQTLGNSVQTPAAPTYPGESASSQVCGCGGRGWGTVRRGVKQVRAESSHYLAIPLGSSNSRSPLFLLHIRPCGCYEINICKCHFPMVVLALNSVD